MNKSRIIQKSLFVFLILSAVNMHISPAYAQIPGLTEAIIGGIVGTSVAARSASGPVKKGVAWSQDIYVSYFSDHLKKNSRAVPSEGDRRGFPVSAKTIHWVGESMYLDSPRPIKAVWVSPDGDSTVTKVTRFSGGTFRATLVNKKDLFSAHQGRWQIRILTASGQEVDRQNFYIGHADVDEESESVKNMREQLNLSKEDAVVVFSKREVIVQQQYGSLERLTKRIMILSDKGKEFAEVFIPVVQDVDHVTINYAYTIKPDGQVVDAREYGIQTFAKSYPDYSVFKFFSMTMPSLQKGSIVEYQILISSPIAKTDGMFFDSYSPRYRLPVIQSSYLLNVPKDMHLNYLQLNTKVDIKETSQGEDRKVYEFSSGPHASIEIEPFMPSPREVLGQVIITTAASWDDIARWWVNRIINKSKVTPDIQVYVDELIKGAVDTKEKIHRIYADVTKSIRYVGLDFGASIYDPADAASVFKNKYGDCKDQSMLLLAMLKAAGIDAHTALVSSGFGIQVQKDIPNVNEFNHVIVVAQDGDQKYFLDPTLKKYAFGTLPPWLENRYLLHIKDNQASFEFLPLSGHQINQTVTSIDLNFDDHLNVRGTAKIQWNGQENGDIRQYLYLLESNKQKEEFVDAVLKGVYSYAFRDSYEFKFEEDVDSPLVLQIAFHMDNWLLDAGGGNSLLQMYGGDVKVPDFVAKNRVFPVRLNSMDKQSMRITVKIPDRFDVEVPEPFALSNEYISNHVQYTYKDHLLQLDQELYNLKVDVPLDQIDSLRAAWEKISQANRKGVLLKPKKK
jgi:hypothetical protein